MTRSDSAVLPVLVRELLLVTMALMTVAGPTPTFAWGPEGHKAIVILAESYMRPETLARVRQILGPENVEEASTWADQIRTARPETGPWHYINIPLRDSKIDLRKDCPGGQCVLLRTQEFIRLVGDPHTSVAARREALKFVIHFISDLHQPLHCEDHRDEGGNRQRVIFEGRPDNLHWVWDTGLVGEINPDPRALATELGREVTSQERTSWQQGDVASWVLESHQLAQAAYRRIWFFGPPVLSASYDDHAKAVVRLQLEKAAVRLAYLLNQRLN